jgi:hypothetical protein
LTTPTEALARAGQWYLRSGIQDPDGGVARYYLINEARNLPVSNEITGYAASAYAYLHEVTGAPEYRAAAEKTASFLITRAWNAELKTFPFECLPGSPAYFFDCGIMIRGLLAVWRMNRDQRLLDIAVECGHSMARDFLTGTAIHPVVSLPDRKPWPYEKRWSREPGCFQLKSALAWRMLAVLTGDNRFLQYWQRAQAMAKANDPHFLPGAEEPERVMDRLHAYSYYLEALLADPGPELRAGIERASHYLEEIAPRFARSDVHAQLMRVRLLAGEEAGDPQVIESFQYRVEDPRLDGGFSFGRKPEGLLPFANPVSTAFCMQALEMWRQRQSINLDSLI